MPLLETEIYAPFGMGRTPRTRSAARAAVDA